LVTASGEAGYDPLRQFAELAGDVRDPYPMFAGIRAETPVLHVEVGGGSGRYRHDEKAPRITSLFTVTSHDLAQQILTDHERFSSAANAMTIGPVMGRTILEMDPPEHQRHRALVAKAFRARILDRWSDAIIGRCVGELIDEFAGDGHADLIPELTFPFPVQVIARILGLPEADWPNFLRLSAQLIAVMRNWEGAVAASRELRGYFAEIIADRRRHTRDDLVSQLISAEVDRGLVPLAIEEALRWETPLLTVARLATEDTELGGVHIPAGSFVAVSLGAANRDPERYTDPDAFDVLREGGQAVSFGNGIHKCLGMHLARMEMRVLLNAVLDRLPGLRLDPDAEDVHIHGLIFRSPPNLPVRFDPA
jgi:cytochrome P450